MKKYILSAMLLCASFAQAQMKVEVSNPTDVQRQELVGISYDDVCQKLGIKSGEPFIVRNAIGQEVDYQVTYDGQLLVDASVIPNGKAEFTIDKGVPRRMMDYSTLPIRTAKGWGVGRMWAHGSLYPDRLDDIAWENDRGAYRVYGPAFQKSGSIGYGPDVWVKNTPELDIDSRFRMDIDIKPTQKQLNDAGYTAEANQLLQANSFHIDHGTGNDCYAVGSTLGCGGVALINPTSLSSDLSVLNSNLSDQNLVFVNGWETYEILDNGPLRFTVSLAYPDTIINNVKYKQHRIISLDKGSNFNKVEVWYDAEQVKTKSKKTKTSLNSHTSSFISHLSSFNLATGFPLHSPNEKTLMTGNGYMQYADPTDNPAGNNCELYIACLFPQNDVVMGQAIGHALAIKTVKSGEHWTFFAGTAWSKYDVRNQHEWQTRINTALDAIRHPLIVK